APHAILGAHVGDGSVTIRTVKHLADDVQVVTPAGTFQADHEQDGVWVAAIEGSDIPDYRLKVTYGDVTSVVDDPYRYLPTLGELDLHLIGEGRHEKLWKVLGSHVRHYSGQLGDVD